MQWAIQRLEAKCTGLLDKINSPTMTKPGAQVEETQAAVGAGCSDIITGLADRMANLEARTGRLEGNKMSEKTADALFRRVSDMESLVKQTTPQPSEELTSGHSQSTNPDDPVTAAAAAAAAGPVAKEPGVSGTKDVISVPTQKGVAVNSHATTKEPNKIVPTSANRSVDTVSHNVLTTNNKNKSLVYSARIWRTIHCALHY